MKMKAEDGKLYAEITLRDVVEKNDVSDMPLLAEVKRLYDENAKLRELLEAILQCSGETKCDKGCDACPMFNGDEAGAFLNKNWCLLRPTMCELGIEMDA